MNSSVDKQAYYSHMYCIDISRYKDIRWIDRWIHIFSLFISKSTYKIFFIEIKYLYKIIL